MPFESTHPRTRATAANTRAPGDGFRGALATCSTEASGCSNFGAWVTKGVWKTQAFRGRRGLASCGRRCNSGAVFRAWPSLCVGLRLPAGSRYPKHACGSSKPCMQARSFLPWSTTSDEVIGICLPAFSPLVCGLHHRLWHEGFQGHGPAWAHGELCAFSQTNCGLGFRSRKSISASVLHDRSVD